VSVNDRLQRLEADARKVPCPTCGRVGLTVAGLDVLRLSNNELEAIAWGGADRIEWMTGKEVETVNAAARQAAVRKRCGQCRPNAPCAAHRFDAVLHSVGQELRNCTTDELRTIRGILAGAARRAGQPEKPS
jgi:hypothetical protein